MVFNVREVLSHTMRFWFVFDVVKSEIQAHRTCEGIGRFDLSEAERDQVVERDSIALVHELNDVQVFAGFAQVEGLTDCVV